MRPLNLSVIQAGNFRSAQGLKLEDTPNWRGIRAEVLKRDDKTCYYCGFRSEKYMEVHHLGGEHFRNDPENLVTLCPLCHSCHHIGFSGISGKGRLLFVREQRNKLCDQSYLNHFILEKLNSDMGVKYGIDRVLEVIYDMIPVQKDLGAAGLIAMADMMLDGKVPDTKSYLFFPNSEGYRIFEYIITRKKG